VKEMAELTLEKLVFKRLLELNSSSIIRFPIIFERICPILCLKKREAWQVLKSLESLGLIKIFPYHGIKIIKQGHG
jgi:Mn-dependent DtxR family transcriptional regulator